MVVVSDHLNGRINCKAWTELHPHNNGMDVVTQPKSEQLLLWHCHTQ
jgi:hypothetical protein